MLRLIVGFLLVININTSNASCDSLGYTPPKRYLSQIGSVKNISLYWGSDPSHAVSALFKVIVHYAHGYQNVNLIQGPYSLNDLATQVIFSSSGTYNDTIIAVSTGWEPELETFQELEPGGTSGLGAPRLDVITANKMPVRVRLYAYMPKDFRIKKQCENFTQWSFYTDVMALRNCGFNNNIQKNRAVVFFIHDSSNRPAIKSQTLQARANASVIFTRLNRKKLFEKKNMAIESFLFIDFDMWFNSPFISRVQEPPCLISDGPTCVTELDNAINLRVTESYVMGEFASQLFQLAHVFVPPLDSILYILEQTTKGKNIEEAACEWVSENNKTVYKNWVKKYEAHEKIHEIVVFYCTTDDEANKYEELIGDLQQELKEMLGLNIVIRYFNITKNFNTNFVKEEISYYLSYSLRQRLIGAVIGGDNNMSIQALHFDKIGIPVLYYDVSAVDVDKTESVWLATGRSIQLAIAIRHFIHKNNWIRVAILSDSTHIAKQFLDDLYTCTVHLTSENKMALRDHPITQMTASNVKRVLKELQAENAHIIIVNTNAQDAVTIFKSAAELYMNNEMEYAWILREWKEDNNRIPSNFKHYTISFCCPDRNYTSGSFGKHIYKKINKLWGVGSWPREAAALVDAVLVMAKGFENVVTNYPQAREDPHSEEAIRQFESSLIELSPIEAFTQDLVYKKHSLEQTVMYLHEWRNGNRKTLAQWHVNTTANTVTKENIYGKAYYKEDKPDDGTSRCLLSTGDLYLPSCQDYLWITAIVLVTVGPLLVVLIYRAIHRRLNEMQSKILNDLLAQRKQRAATLTSYLVDRNALRLRRELGEGRFGRVMLADLVIPGSKTQVVAAKELRDHENEQEILQEACILASLKHDNIIRLVGVCIDDEPALVLMEVAFFGDLLHYLEDRRYLAEVVATNTVAEMDKDYEEATHVSPRELTRLAREAASALAYLSFRGVVHRDLRASNCLVDAKRSLKLADFGLARLTKNGGGEYACRRRGIFPVLWMAPESLIYGVFTTASDVYSLGVLLYELVTLGARPYGKISPLRVMRFVSSGGKPSMPRDATPQTVALAQLCWQREPEKRPSAADVVAYLAERPNALSPALEYEDYHPDNDSGYGDSPSTEILLPWITGECSWTCLMKID